jgi:molybdopterin/thiamine biosynthesis adenylyltransferase
MARTYHEMLAEARTTVTEITPGELAERDGVTIVDVREPDEWVLGSINNAVLIPRGTLEYTIAKTAPDRDTPLVLYCAIGHRSVLAARALQDLGYTDVSSLDGGFERWKKERRDWTRPEGLSTDQHARYARHLSLDGVGMEGQRKLLDAKVLVLGAGGLGSPAALYLAAAGVGTIGIVDFDEVEISNLQRQVLHDSRRVGTLKAESARDTLNALNPDIKIEPHADRLTSENALELMSGYDVVVDGTDNFPTRYLVNDASLHLRLPVVHGSIFRFEGQATVFTPYDGPCYRCLFPNPPPPELAPNCAEAGVLGVLPGVIGSIQATEALKMILGVGNSLSGRLLTYDALEQSFLTLNLQRDPDCPACADEERLPRLVDYDDACIPAGLIERG